VVSQPETSADVVRLARPDVGEEELAEIREVLDSGQLTMGPKVAEFEALLADAAGTEHAVAVSSGTAALHVAVLALGLGPGDEVLVPAYTFPATANVVALVGATPVLVDVDPMTMNMDPADAARRVTPRTKALLAVHLFGRARAHRGAAGTADDRGRRRRARRNARWPSLRLARRARLLLVPSAQDRDDRGGRRGLDERCRARGARPLAPPTTAGRRRTATPTCPSRRSTTRLSDVLCALGIPQLRRLDELHAAYERVAAGYAERLAGLDVVLPEADPGDRHGLQAYVLQVDRRDEVLAGLRAQGIQCQIGTYALHRLGAYASQGPFPGADTAFERALALPPARAAHGRGARPRGGGA